MRYEPELMQMRAAERMRQAERAMAAEQAWAERPGRQGGFGSRLMALATRPFRRSAGVPVAGPETAATATAAVRSAADIRTAISLSRPAVAY